MSDDARRLILARRARFIASAVAGLAVGACDSCDAKRGVTNDAPTTQSTSTGPAACLKPTVCLSPPMRQQSTPAGEDAAALLRALTALEDDAGPTALGDDAGPALRGEVTTSTSVTGAVPRVELTVRAAFTPRARKCYVIALASDPKMAGRAVLTLQVASSGDVDSASMTSATGLSSQLSACLMRVAKALQFQRDAPADASSAGTVTITATFSLPR